jgi:hypothetical protein
VVATVKRIGRDKLRLRLSGEEIALLRSLPDQLRSVLAGAGSPDPSTSLFSDPTLGIDDPSGALDPWDPRRDAPADPDPKMGPPPGAGEAGPHGDQPDRPPGAGRPSDDPDEWPEDAGTGQRARGEAAGDLEDPVLERLFPRAYLEPEDLDRDAEYQRLVRDDLLEAKLANLDVVTKTLDRGTVSLRRWTVDVTEEEAGAWLGALNDLRLALGVRLGITEDFEGDVDPSDPQAPALHVLSYLGWLEENLLEALTSA